jgi:chitodextrinase
MRKTFWLIAAVMVWLPSILQAATATQITQYGITWTFSQAQTVGQFANGDWWVVGPVTINSITPAFDGTHNGWEVNPSSTTSQGFDTRASSFSAGLVPSLPYTAQTNRSIVKSISVDIAQATCRPCLRAAAVLTVVPAVPVDSGRTCFRPPYFGATKTYYSTNDLHTELLPSLAPVAGTPTFGAAQLTRVFLDHQSGWGGAGIHPSENMPEYGSSVAMATGDAALRLMLDDALSLKMPSLIGYVQVGIDLYHARLGGATWPSNGGHASGRKLPIAFAGYLLNHQGMKDAVSAATYDTYQEDGHLYWSQKANSGAGQVLFGNEQNETGYWALVITDGGNRTTRDPYGYIDGGMIPGDSYQLCCNSMTWKAHALMLNIMPPLEVIWNNDHFLLYEDRWANFGAWAQPDPCAPVDAADMTAGVFPPASGNYGVTYGPNGSGDCIRDLNPADGTGRFPTKHGSNKDQGAYVSQFAISMWMAYRNADVYPPHAPSGLNGASISDHAITLTWTAPTPAEDGDGAVYYILKRNNVQVSTSFATTFVDEHLAAATQYAYAVYAVDNAGNVSLGAATASLTTSADNAGPLLDTVFTADQTTVVVVFNEAVGQASAENTGNFTIPGVSVVSAVRDQNQYTVMVTTTAHTAGNSYTLTATSIQDLGSRTSSSLQKTYTAQDGFFDDFEAGTTAKWTPSASANWEVLDDAGDKSLHCKTTTAERLLAPVNFNTFTLTCDLKGEGGSVYRTNCVIFGYQDTSNYYYVQFAGSSNTTYNGIFKVANNVTTKVAGTGSAALLTETANYHAVKMTVDQNTGSINVWFDGNPAFALIDNTYHGGQAGVWCKTKTGFFDNVRVQRYIETTVGIPGEIPAIPILEQSRVFTMTPNPGNGTNVFRFTMNSRGIERQIRIYSPTGVCVRRLEIPVNQAAVVWDGRDARGQRVEPGVYLVKCGRSFEKSVLVK